MQHLYTTEFTNNTPGAIGLSVDINTMRAELPLTHPTKKGAWQAAAVTDAS